MNLRRIILITAMVIALPYINCFSQEPNQDSIIAQDIESAMVEKQFVILKSSTDYKEALLTAQKASKSLNMKLDLRGLTENKAEGLTFDKKFCEDENGFPFPCYVPRGRYDDGDFISIEYSSAYQGFTKGYYIVVASSHLKNAKEISSILKLVRNQYKDAYVKTSKVYMGCIH
jgi:hypothetical protein